MSKAVKGFQKCSMVFKNYKSLSRVVKSDHGWTRMVKDSKGCSRVGKGGQVCTRVVKDGHVRASSASMAKKDTVGDQILSRVNRLVIGKAIQKWSRVVKSREWKWFGDGQRSWKASGIAWESFYESCLRRSNGVC